MVFQYVRPTEEQQKLMQKFRDDFTELYKKIKTEAPDSRGRSLCLTKLEEASFWLNKGITRNDTWEFDDE